MPRARDRRTPPATPIATRALRSLAGVFVLTWAFRISGYGTFASWSAIPVVLLGLLGLLVIVAAWLPTSVVSRRQHQIGWVALTAIIAALAIWSYFQVFTAPDYGTDEIAFDQYAAQLALHGINPYLHSMAPAFPLFHVSPNGYTFQLNGQPVTALSYPALAFEAYLPLLAAGVTTQAAVWVEIFSWALAAAVLYAVLPRSVAPLAAWWRASTSTSATRSAGSPTRCSCRCSSVPPWAGTGSPRPRARGLARARLHGPGHGGEADSLAGAAVRGRRDRAGIPAAEGNAAGGARRPAVHGNRARGVRRAEPPVPVAAPGAWLNGILTPFNSHTVPAGQGLVDISLSLMTGGGSLTAYNVAAAVVLAAMLACYVTTYPALKPAAFLLPSIALFFADRSFGSYLVMLVPAALAAAATTSRPADCRARGTGDGWRPAAAGRLRR